MDDAQLRYTISEMYRLASQYSGDVSRFQLSSVYNIFDFVRNVPYERDIDSCAREECLKRPSYAISGGDCDDKSILAGAFLSLAGIPWRFVTTSSRADKEIEHVYLEIFYQGEWKPFDATYSTNTIFQERPYTRKIIWDNDMIYDRKFNVSTLEGNLGLLPLPITDLIGNIVDINKVLQALPVIGALFRGKTQHETYDLSLQKSQEFENQASAFYTKLPDDNSKAYFLNLCQNFFLNWVMPDLGHRWNNAIANDYAKWQLNAWWDNPAFRCAYYLGQPVFFFLFLEDIERIDDSIQAWYTKPVADKVWTPMNNYLQSTYSTTVQKVASGDVNISPSQSTAGFGGAGLLLIAGLGVTMLLGKPSRGRR